MLLPKAILHCAYDLLEFEGYIKFFVCLFVCLQRIYLQCKIVINALIIVPSLCFYLRNVVMFFAIINLSSGPSY